VRVLVVGAGVAGLTLAARLCRQGGPPLIVEREATQEAGYALALYPLGANVVHGLGAYAELTSLGLLARCYRLADGGGRLLQEVDVDRLTGAVGPMVLLSRADLLDLLRRAAAPASLVRGVTVIALQQDRDAVDVVLSDGTEGRFDAVVGCDGIGSRTRRFVGGTPSGVDTGWSLVTWWSGSDGPASGTMREWWGRGWFLGAYPTRGGAMCAAGGPRLDPGDPGKAVQELLGDTADRLPEVAALLPPSDPAWVWPMRDARARRWVEGRVALCGDAAAGFLPTAGVGASLAMRCAAVLAEELSLAGADTVALALDRYERRCRRITESDQAESRRLARFMFVESAPAAWLRDRAARRYPAERMLRSIIRSTREAW
jgi:2-polyprenyl-6-methoxyphenol hydroxylase-like FAD-dependent oxidoreductase